MPNYESTNTFYNPLDEIEAEEAEKKAKEAKGLDVELPADFNSEAELDMSPKAFATIMDADIKPDHKPAPWMRRDYELCFKTMDAALDRFLVNPSAALIGFLGTTKSSAQAGQLDFYRARALHKRIDPDAARYNKIQFLVEETTRGWAVVLRIPLPMEKVILELGVDAFPVGGTGSKRDPQHNLEPDIDLEILEKSLKGWGSDK